jgi:hypothetical protein
LSGAKAQMEVIRTEVQSLRAEHRHAAGGGRSASASISSKSSSNARNA